jgi:hypothetical protein
MARVTQAARTLAVLMCKHEYDARYQTLDDKLYISQHYFPIIANVSNNLWFSLSLFSPQHIKTTAFWFTMSEVIIG